MRGKVPKFQSSKGTEFYQPLATDHHKPIGCKNCKTCGTSNRASPIFPMKCTRPCPDASPAKPARPSARSMWTSRNSGQSSSRPTTPATCARCGIISWAAPNGADAGFPEFLRLPTRCLTFPHLRCCSGSSAWWTCRASAQNQHGHDYTSAAFPPLIPTVSTASARSRNP